MRECYSCGSIKTYVRNDNQENWYRNKPFEQWLCERCNNHLIKNPKWHPITHPITNPITSKKWNQINSTKRLKFHDKQIILDNNPRTGYCSWCTNNIFDKSCKHTHIHHKKYHINDPLEDTIELCPSCHRKETIRLKTV